jgi:hypothetical protein
VKYNIPRKNEKANVIAFFWISVRFLSWRIGNEVIIVESVFPEFLFAAFFRACVRIPLDFSGFKMYIIQLMHFFIQEKTNAEQPEQHERGG